MSGAGSEGDGGDDVEWLGEAEGGGGGRSAEGGESGWAHIGSL